MLIKCPECNLDVSDKAISCPHCGFPINVGNYAPTMQKRRKTPNSRFQRNPNGFGSVSFLKGNRRRPWVAYPPVKAYTEKGSPIRGKAIGYYETRGEALSALVEYNNHPYDLDKSRLTFADVFDMYMTSREKSGNFSSAAKASYISGFKYVSDLHKSKIVDLRKTDFQRSLDSCTLSVSTSEAMRKTIRQVCKFAYDDGIIDKDYSVNIKINNPNKCEKGVPFSEQDIARIWEMSEDIQVQTVLVFIYTGYRVSELLTAKYDADEGIFVGGMKSDAGKDRIVPIHSAISPFVGDVVEYLKDYYPNKYRKTVFYNVMQMLGLEYAPNGAKRTPHDCRHTFSWLCDHYKMDPTSKYMIIGHSFGGDVDKSVYGHRTIDELKSEIEKIQVDCKQIVANC